MRSGLVLTLWAFGFIFAAYPQATNNAPVAFEVASIKPNTTGSRASSTRRPNDRSYVGTNVTVRQLILAAYSLRPLQLKGGPGWVDSDRFDLDARAAEPASREQILAMLRALLAERFKLVAHQETKEQPIYALVVARNDGKLGAQLKLSTMDCGTPAQPNLPNNCGTNTNVNNEGGTMNGSGRSASEIATALSTFVTDRMVIDRTGLAGRYDFEIRWTPDNVQSTAAGTPTRDAPSLFAALPEQLGLKLEAQRGPVEFLVIDSIDKPTPN